MRSIRCGSVILWVGVVILLWVRTRPLVPDTVIRTDSLSPILQITSDGKLAICQYDGLSESSTGPIAWYNGRTGRLIKTVLSERHREIEQSPLPGRPPISPLELDGQRVVANLWTGQILAPLHATADDRDYAISPDGRYFASFARGKVHVLETDTLKHVLTRPAVRLLGFYGNEVLGIRERTAQGDSTTRDRDVALSVPDGSVTDIDSPLDKSPLLSPNGTLLLKTVEGMQAAVCDARTGEIIWQTKIAFPTPPASIPAQMYRFDASGEELRVVYSDEQGRLRFARWRVADGQVIAPLPVAFDPPRQLHGVDFDMATGATSMSTTVMSPYEHYQGDIASDDGRFTVQPVDSSWDELKDTLVAGLEALESSVAWINQLQLSSHFDAGEDDSSLAVLDTTTGERVGSLAGGDVFTPSDSSWFAVQDLHSIRIYSSPFRPNWTSLLAWATLPPTGAFLSLSLTHRLRKKRNVTRAEAVAPPPLSV